MAHTDSIEKIGEKGEISKEELARALKKILVQRKSMRFTDNQENIEGRVTERDVVEAKIRVIEQSELWKEHAKTHKEAKLTPLEVNTKDPKSIRQSLGLENVDYKMQENIEFVGYNKAPAAQAGNYSPSPMPHSGSGQYIAATSNPENKEFWMGCTCGVTIKAEEGVGPTGKAGIHLSTYDIGSTSNPSTGYEVATGSSYSVSNSSSYNRRQSSSYS